MLTGKHHFSSETERKGDQSKDGRTSFRCEGEKSGGWKCEEQKIGNKMSLDLAC